jgi:SagB-type dehydrogenase family enzyme
MEAYRRHRSYRDYSDEPVAAQDLGALLSKLQSVELDGKPKYLYASAGGLYPVQIYVYAKDGRCENLRAGSFYYDPAAGDLVGLESGTPDVRSLYDPIINRPIFDQAAFALFLVADLEAIGAMYPDRAIHYVTLEAGHITQLLEMTAPEHGIGLCQIGGLETGDFAELLKLEKNHLLLHGLLGGYIAHDSQTAAAATSSERDEGEI